VVADLAVGGGRQRFALLPQGDADSRPRPIPNVTYDYIRAGVDLRVYTGGPLTIYGGGHYRHVLAAGLIKSEDWFPSASIWGAEANLGVGYRFMSCCEARLHGDMRLYNMTMAPDSGDMHVTDGARDQYWSASLSLAAFLGGTK
jgi:hypothetical protein